MFMRTFMIMKLNRKISAKFCIQARYSYFVNLLIILFLLLGIQVFVFDLLGIAQGNWKVWRVAAGWLATRAELIKLHCKIQNNSAQPRVAKTVLNISREHNARFFKNAFFLTLWQDFPCHS